MKKTSPKSQAPKPPLSLDDMARELAAGLRDVIEETDMSALKRDPEEAFVDLACRLVFRLRSTLTVMPIPTAEERIQTSLDAAATRTLSILTKWMRENLACSYDTRKSASGKFQIIMTTSRGVQLFFGDDLQDAYAQAAQTVSFNEAP
jgi:hypothetical protein